ncbi:phosphoribosylanthranilate isomerase [Desulfovibrio litoralis]|uniref:N-(5'-phosphoribosyl)anthranilate isomerase n=1 Tax=Desulfovibrio litoralis DSM 11393 TaxID=1121455 RepID=A0A1M7SEQ3_9BACT|nr:phosphoribosylanthranilate isomerase [Desulfovibrio litoralis]SHN56914.1 phosphoribosylanthranilate isomerase [Desulfovibrio litoralis DSM 11393]
MSTTLKLKVCGLTRPEDIQTCCEQGIDFTGLIFASKSPRKLTLEQAQSLLEQSVQAFKTYKTKKVGVFVKQPIDEVREIATTLNLDYIQLHGDEDEAFCNHFKPEKIIKVVWADKIAEKCKDKNEFQTKFEAELKRFSSYCAYFLCDAGKSGGGSGECLNWLNLSTIKFPKPWFLAGGLNLNNASQAFNEAKPNVLDFNSGLELSPGIKDCNKIIQLNQWRSQI